MDDTQQEPTYQDRLEALQMALATKRFQSLSDDYADCDALQAACEERTALLRRYFSKTFGANVVPLTHAS